MSRVAAVAVLLLGTTAAVAAAHLYPETMAAWDTYVSATERRIARELGSPDGFLVLDFSPGAAAARRALLAGDIVQVVLDRRWVSFMWSYPNLVPLPAATVRQMVEKLEPYEFDRVYGAWWGRVVDGDGKERVRVSAERYLDALQSSPSQ